MLTALNCVYLRWSFIFDYLYFEVKYTIAGGQAPINLFALALSNASRREVNKGSSVDNY